MDHNLIYSLGCYSFILSCIFFAAIRWGHVCSPYVKYADQFFPARKTSIFFLLLTVIMFPYVFHPMRTETWILVKFYGILVMPTTWIMLFHKYFDPSGYKRERHKLHLIASVPILTVLLLFVLSIVPKNLSEQQINQITYIGTGIGAFLSAILSIRPSGSIARPMNTTGTTTPTRKSSRYVSPITLSGSHWRTR